MQLTLHVDSLFFTRTVYYLRYVLLYTLYYTAGFSEVFEIFVRNLYRKKACLLRTTMR